MKTLRKFLLLLLIMLPVALVACTNTPGDGGDPVRPGGDDDKDKTEIRVNSVALGSSFVVYNANKALKDNKNTEFFDLTQNYFVGDDNPWSFKPDTSFIKINLTTNVITPVEVSEWEYDITLEVLVENAFVKADSSFVDAIDTKAVTVNFSEKAIGHSFRISCCPQKLTEKQAQNKAKFTVSFEFDVIDGYNCYFASDLAYLDNRASSTAEGAAWDSYRTEHKIDTSINPQAIIFQRNISLTKKDLPGLFFYSESDLSKTDSDYERTLGSLKDYYSIYQRNLAKDEKFLFEGNYFTLDTSSIPVVTRESGNITAEGEVISHATVIRYSGEMSGDVTMKDLNFIGNAPKVEDTLKSGGLIVLKVEGPKFLAYNNITICTFIAYFPNYTLAKFTMDKCKAYDSFNSFIYNWGSPDVEVFNCEMIGAGGPVIIQDHVDAKNADGGRVGSTIIKNSKLASYVTGSEGWFSVVHASAIMPLVKSMDALFNPFGRSFLKTNKDKTLTYLNAISVNKSGSTQGLTKEKIKGNITIDGHNFCYGEDNPVLAQVLTATFENGAPAFESSNATVSDGYGYTDGTGLFDATNTQIVSPTNSIYSGNYICLYYLGMQIVLGYGPVGEIVG